MIKHKRKGPKRLVKDGPLKEKNEQNTMNNDDETEGKNFCNDRIKSIYPKFFFFFIYLSYFLNQKRIVNFKLKHQVSHIGLHSLEMNAFYFNY